MSVSCNLDCDLQKASHKNHLNYAVQCFYSLAWYKEIFLFNFWFGKFWLPWKVQRCFYVAAQKKKIRFLASRQLWNYGAHLVLLVSFYLSPLFSLFSLFVLGICLHTSEHAHFLFWHALVCRPFVQIMGGKGVHFQHTSAAAATHKSSYVYYNDRPHASPYGGTYVVSKMPSCLHRHKMCSWS